MCINAVTTKMCLKKLIISSSTTENICKDCFSYISQISKPKLTLLKQNIDRNFINTLLSTCRIVFCIHKVYNIIWVKHNSSALDRSFFFACRLYSTSGASLTTVQQ